MVIRSNPRNLERDQISVVSSFISVLFKITERLIKIGLDHHISCNLVDLAAKNASTKGIFTVVS